MSLKSMKITKKNIILFLESVNKMQLMKKHGKTVIIPIILISIINSRSLGNRVGCRAVATLPARHPTQWHE